MTLAVIGRDVAQGWQADVLTAIGNRDVALAVWDRELPSGLPDMLGQIDFDAIDDVGIELAVNESPELALRDAGYSDAAAAALTADIALLIGHHAALTRADRVSLRLEVVETDACHRFHADYVRIRLLCTYVGSGTQWQRVAAPDTVHEIATGAVALLKGRLLLDPPTILHRSPPIGGRGLSRLLLAIDPA